jgi:hypothetical protein
MQSRRLGRAGLELSRKIVMIRLSIYAMVALLFMIAGSVIGNLIPLP